MVYKMNENLNEKIICLKCGGMNNKDTNFCVHCGNNIQINKLEETEVINTIPIQVNLENNERKQFTETVQQPIYNNLSNNEQIGNTKSDSLDFIKYIFGTILKPFDNFKKEEDKLNDFKNNGILALIIVGFMTIINLFRTMLDAVRVTSFWSKEVEWVWKNLAEVEYLKEIGQSLLIYTGIMFAVSGVYFLACLVIKKDVKFVKMFGVAVTSIIPFALSTSIVSPLLSLIYSPLGICVNVVGTIYSFVIFIEIMNEIINIENKNTKIYFHLICLSILVIGGSFIAYKLILSSLSSSLGGLSGL